MGSTDRKSNSRRDRLIKFYLDIDIYLAIIAAVTLTIISAFNPDSRALLDALILSSLIVVLITMIGIRSRIDKVSNELSRKGESPITSSLPADFEDRLEKCDEIWIIGIHQHELFTAYRNRIINIGRKKTSRIRILLLEPDGVASEMTAMRFASDIPPVLGERQKIKDSLLDLENMREHTECDFQIRTIDFLLPYGAILLDRHKADRARMYIERYTFKVKGGPAKPKILYLPDSDWYDLFDREIQELWKEGKTI